MLFLSELRNEGGANELIRKSSTSSLSYELPETPSAKTIRCFLFRTSRYFPRSDALACRSSGSDAWKRSVSSTTMTLPTCLSLAEPALGRCCTTGRCEHAAGREKLIFCKVSKHKLPRRCRKSPWQHKFKHDQLTSVHAGHRRRGSTATIAVQPSAASCCLPISSR